VAFDPLADPEQHDEAILSVLSDRGPTNQYELVLALRERHRSWPSDRGRPAAGTQDAALIAWMLSARKRGLVTVDGDGFFNLEAPGAQRLRDLTA
jgi:hypothetical protein